MKELITMWKNTRMIVLTAVSAAVYAAVLIPFKVAIPLIPGFTEVRPANVIPIICSLMFGPAAAWGSAIGNTIADVFGTLTLGTIPGFIGNFLYGYIPYRMWRAFAKGEPIAESRRSTMQSGIIAVAASAVITLCYAGLTKGPLYIIILIAGAVLVSVFLVLRFLSVRFFVLILSASAACGVFIGWAAHVMGLVPFSALGNIIVLNNLLASAVLGPILLPILYPVVKRMGLLYTDVMEESHLSRPRAWGSALMIVAVIAGLIVGNWIAIGGYKLGVLGAGFGPVLGRGGLGLGLLPFIILMLLAAAVM
jgi:energy-coupling factor transport system substrate-specific component